MTHIRDSKVLISENFTFITKASSCLPKNRRVSFVFSKSIINIQQFQHYCYEPTNVDKQNMYHGMTRHAKDPNMRPEEQRPELSPHYEEAKRRNTERITFCPVCSDASCGCNKQIIQLWATTLELICNMANVEGGKIVLSMHHFFTCGEMVYFLQNFTKESR